MKDEDLSMGCQGCHELISTENYNALPAKNFDNLPFNPTSYPSKIDFELSNECNLECIMCRGEFSSAIRKNREQLPPIKSVYDQNFIDQLEEFIPHISHSHFLGGEPFMIPIYLDIWDRMIKLNPTIRISVQTNGTILTGRVKAILNSMKFEIGVSIDSIDETNYQLIRKNGNFKKVLSNIEYFRNYCKENKSLFHISFCPMIQNWQELPAVIRYVNSLDCEVFFNTVSFPKECSLSYLSANELDKIIESLSNEELPENSIIQKRNKESYLQIINHLRFWKKEAESRELFFTKTADIPIDIQSYFNGLKEYINNEEDMSVPNKAKLYTTIYDKLHYVLKIAKEQEKHHEAENHIIQIGYKKMIDHVPDTNKEHLLYLFKSYIMPLSD
jgi:sulfatase maturation enzyme AslB (radical SAM superfamily)